MKIKSTIDIKSITHNDLVNLFSTALYGSDYLGADYPDLNIYEEGDCYEDKLAKALLADKNIEVNDFYAEGETDFYGALPHHYDDKNECMYYQVELKDIAKGIEIAVDNGGYDAECARHLIDEDREFDLYEAENLLQIIVFGKTIYG